MKKIKSIFAVLSAGYRSDISREGKSGQQRATHRLTAGFRIVSGNITNDERDSATENNYPDFGQGKAENVR